MASSCTQSPAAQTHKGAYTTWLQHRKYCQPRGSTLGSKGLPWCCKLLHRQANTTRKLILSGFQRYTGLCQTAETGVVRPSHHHHRRHLLRWPVLLLQHLPAARHSTTNAHQTPNLASSHTPGLTRGECCRCNNTDSTNPSRPPSRAPPQEQASSSQKR